MASTLDDVMIERMSLQWSRVLHESIDGLSADAKGTLTRRWLERMLYELAPDAFHAAGLVDEAKRFALLKCTLADAKETVHVLEELRDCVESSDLWARRTNPECSSLRAAKQCARFLAEQFEALVACRNPSHRGVLLGGAVNSAASLLMQMALWVDVAHANLPDRLMTSAPFAQRQLDLVRREIGALGGDL